MSRPTEREEMKMTKMEQKIKNMSVEELIEKWFKLPVGDDLELVSKSKQKEAELILAEIDWAMSRFTDEEWNRMVDDVMKRLGL